MTVERDRTGYYTTVVPVGRPLDNTQAYCSIGGCCHCL